MTAMRMAYVIGACVALSACAGGLSVRDVEERCAADSRLADGIGGEVRAGVGTGGVRGGLRLTVTDRILNPVSPEDFYDDCVFQRTGQGPTRTLAQVLR